MLCFKKNINQVKNII